MQCERCRARLSEDHLCATCGRDGIQERIEFREKLPPMIRGWRDSGLIEADALVDLVRQVHLEVRSLKRLRANRRRSASTDDTATFPAPSPPKGPPRAVEPRRALPEQAPAPPARSPQLYPLPGSPSSRDRSLAELGGFLRERTGWVTGVVLTVVGSFYLAGTVWGDLTATLRALVVVGFLAVYTLGFTVLGSRLGRVPAASRAGRWLLGVAAALAPVHAMSTAGLWDSSPVIALGALAAVVALHHLILRRTFAVILPRDNRILRVCYLGLSGAVGLIPAVSGPGWLLVPALIALVGLWATLTRYRGLPGAAAGLLAHALAFHLYLTPPGPAPLYAPVVALAALAVLYADVALARFRGLHGVKTRALRGVLALELAGAAFILVLPNFQFLPVGYESALTGLFLAVFCLGASLGWQRPVLGYGALAGLLLFTLSLPDLARAIVAPLLAAAGTALGYESEPLPLAWYSLTLVPYLLACLGIRWRLGRLGWRQGVALAEVTFRWCLGLSALLLVVAHSRGVDLRPALFAIPAYSVIWLLRPRVRGLAFGTLPALALVAWSADLLLQLVGEPASRIGVGLALVVALIPLARLVSDRTGDRSFVQGARVIGVVAAALLPWILGGVHLPVAALLSTGAGLWLVSFTLREGPDVTRSQVAVEACLALAGQVALAVGVLAHGVQQDWSQLTCAWLAMAGALAAAAFAWALPRWRTGVRFQAVALLGWSHLLFAVVVFAMAPAEGLPRLVLDAGLLGLMVHWLWVTRSRAHGALLVAAAAFKVSHQLWAHADLGAADLAVVAALVAWIPAAILLGWSGRLPRQLVWMPRAVGEPAGWIGLAAVLAPLAVGGPRWHGWALVAAVPSVLAVLVLRRGGVKLEIAWLVSLFATLVAGLLGGLDRLELLAGAMLGLTLWVGEERKLQLPVVGAWARQSRVGWHEIVLLGWILLGALASQRLVVGHPSVQLAGILVASAALWIVAQRRHVNPRWARAAGVVGPWLALAAAPLWVAETARLAIGFELGWACLGLWAAAGLAVLYRLPLVARLLAPWAVVATLLAVDAPWMAHPAALLALASVMTVLPGQGPLKWPYVRALIVLGVTGVVLAPSPGAWETAAVLLCWIAAIAVWARAAGRDPWIYGAMAIAPLALLEPGSLVALDPRLVAGAPVAFSLVAAALGIVWHRRGRRELALLLGLVAVEALALWSPGAASAIPAALALGAAAAAWVLGHRRMALALHWTVAPLCLVPASGGQIAVFATAAALSVAHTLRSRRPAEWYLSLSWLAALYALLRLAGPLEFLSPRDDLYALVGLAVALEVAVLLLGPRGDAFTRPLRLVTAILPAVGLLLALACGGLAVPALMAAGGVYCLRYVFRVNRVDLIAGLALLDAAALLLVVQQGWSQPLAFVAPVGLSVLVAAQLLRRGLDPRVVALMRYAAAAAIYLAALADAVGTPMWSLVLLQMSLVGMAAGAVLRVRAFLFLGSGFAAASLLTELLRFGLAHSQFWALYLTVLGLIILASMVALTLLRTPVTRLQQRFVQVMGEWE